MRFSLVLISLFLMGCGSPSKLANALDNQSYRNFFITNMSSDELLFCLNNNTPEEIYSRFEIISYIKQDWINGSYIYREIKGEPQALVLKPNGVVELYHEYGLIDDRNTQAMASYYESVCQN